MRKIPLFCLPLALVVPMDPAVGGQILEGPGLGFTEFDDNTTGIRFMHHTAGGHFEFNGERRGYASDGFSSTTYEARANASRTHGPRLTTSLSLTGSRSRSQGRRIDLASGSVTARWLPTRTLRVQSQAGIWFWDQENTPNERFIGGYVSLEWRVGLIEAMLRYDRNHWHLRVDRVENRLALHLVRRF